MRYAIRDEILFFDSSEEVHRLAPFHRGSGKAGAFAYNANMRLLILLFSIAIPLLSFADDVPLESLPQAVRETIDTEKGDGVVRSAESYGWGNVLIYRVEIDVDGVPDLELQIAGNGKLIRVDRLRDEKDDDEKDGNDDDKGGLHAG